MNLNDSPSAGPLTAADLATARAYSTGTVYALHRLHYEPGSVLTDDQIEACAVECAAAREPVPSGTHRHTFISRAWLWLRRWL